MFMNPPLIKYFNQPFYSTTVTCEMWQNHRWLRHFALLETAPSPRSPTAPIALIGCSLCWWRALECPSRGEPQCRRNSGTFPVVHSQCLRCHSRTRPSCLLETKKRHFNFDFWHVCCEGANAAFVLKFCFQFFCISANDLFLKKCPGSCGYLKSIFTSPIAGKNQKVCTFLNVTWFPMPPQNALVARDFFGQLHR